MTDHGVRITVDPGRLGRAGSALADCARALELARGHLAEVRAGLERWAVDGNLPWAADRCLFTVEWLGEQAVRCSADLSRQLAAAGQMYAQTEQAVRSGAERDGSATP